MVRFLISIPSDLRDSLKAAAMQRGQSLTGYIRSGSGTTQPPTAISITP